MGRQMDGHQDKSEQTKKSRNDFIGRMERLIRLIM